MRIPRELLDEAGLDAEVEVTRSGHTLVISRPTNGREGWDEQFAKMAQAGDDELLDADTPTEWDESEWNWELHASRFSSFGSTPPLGVRFRRPAHVSSFRQMK